MGMIGVAASGSNEASQGERMRDELALTALCVAAVKCRGGK